MHHQRSRAIKGMLREGELRYIDIRKSPEINGSSGHQLPNNIVDLRGLSENVYTCGDLCKYRRQNGCTLSQTDTGSYTPAPG